MAKEFTTVRIKTRNATRNPRGVNTMSGVILVPPGEETKEIEVSAAEYKSMQASGNFISEIVGEGRTLNRDDNAAVRPSRVSIAGKEIEALKERVDRLEQHAGLSNSSDGGSASGSQPDQSKAEQAKRVLAMADNSSVKFLEFKAAAQDVLGADNTPSKKDDIVEALEKVATEPQS